MKLLISTSAKTSDPKMDALLAKREKAVQALADIDAAIKALRSEKRKASAEANPPSKTFVAIVGKERFTKAKIADALEYGKKQHKAIVIEENGERNTVTKYFRDMSAGGAARRSGYGFASEKMKAKYGKLFPRLSVVGVYIKK